jgi:5,10-methylene-tetrahydrofolate dehydrogenase/methenyl tetrahydrofolate cyclohydrolase
MRINAKEVSPVKVLDPADIARQYRGEVRERIKASRRRLKLVGFLSSESSPSKTYSSYTQAGCEDVGIDFELRHPGRLGLEAAIDEANADDSVHGIIVYYPIFGGEQDRYLKDLVDVRKDIEGLNSFWARKLYHNERYIDLGHTKKAILPCTPLAVIKLLESTRDFGGPQSMEGKTATIFNRSEVVGRPLASMLANDGARVYSFDITGPLLFEKGQVFETNISREEALKDSQVVITGVPSREFPLVSAKEICANAVCINVSTLKNFADDIAEKALVMVPRVGPMTVAMALRNTLRLYDNYHKGG